jgi:hypothetical protein
MTIPLYLHDVFSYFDVRYPTDEEINELVRIELTSPNYWNESRVDLAQNEPLPQIGMISAQEKPPQDPPLVELFTDDILHKHMVSCVQTYSADSPSVTVSAVRTSASKPLIDAPELSKRWGITLQAAAATLEATTQTAVWDIYASSERKVRLKFPSNICGFDVFEGNRTSWFYGWLNLYGRKWLR